MKTGTRHMIKLSPCKGIVARFHQNKFWNGDKLERRETFRVLKRDSCNKEDCPYCAAIRDQLDGDGEYFDRFPDVGSLKPGDKVRMYISIYSTDWESGHADDWGVEVMKVIV
jgi:hypothetical protein